MAGRTFAIGDIHGVLEHLERLLARLPALDADDTLVFMGDYVDRGPDSAGVVAKVRALAASAPARVVALRGSHEDAWLKVRAGGWPEFVLPMANGCYAAYCSFTGQPPPTDPDALPEPAAFKAMLTGAFFPADVVAWLESLPLWYEDEHAIYVHAGLPEVDGRWLHPREARDPKPLLWQRSQAFFRDYRGKRVVFGHTSADCLPQELSCYTSEDSTDLFAYENLLGIDTDCGRGGFLTAVELPSLVVYESR